MMLAPILLTLVLTQPSAQSDVIVVTATRGEEAASAVATPVAVVDTATLQRIGAQHISEVLNRTPGVYLNRGNGVEHLTSIRSPVLTGEAGAGSFLYLEDGVPLRAAGFANINGLFETVDDLAARVEIVRGPGPAIYGSNALHGLVNVITPDPLEAGRLLELETGSFGRSRARAFAGGETRLGAAYLGLSLRTEQGWREDASLSRFALQTRIDGEAGATQWSVRASMIDLDQETATFVGGFEAYRDRALSRTNADPEAFRNARAARVALHLDHAVSPRWHLRSVVYGRSNEMAFRLHFLPSEALETTGHDSFGLQSALVREGGRSRLVVGVDGEWTRGRLEEFQTLPGFGSFPQGLHYDYEVEALVAAGFVQARYGLTETLSIEVGARLEQTAYDYSNLTATGVIGRFLRPASREDEFTTFAPSVGLVWQVRPSAQIFSRAARGVRAPQTSELYRLQPGQSADGVDPETLDSLELGTRLDTARGGRIELVGFAMEKRNVFFRDSDGFNVTDGVTRHTGLELSALQPLTPGLSVRTAVSWAVHEYGFDRPVTNASEVIVEGNRVDTAPEWLWSAQILWQPTDPLEVEAEWSHVGSYFANAANTARYDGHDLVNLRASYVVGGGMSVFAAVRNAGDVRFAERADFAFGNYRYFPGEPRSVSIGLRIAG